LKISRIIWLEDIVEKLLRKHNVEEREVIDVLENKPLFQRKEVDYNLGEDVYTAFSLTNRKRLLSVFFVYTQDRRTIIISDRDMLEKERRRYAS